VHGGRPPPASTVRKLAAAIDYLNNRLPRKNLVPIVSNEKRDPEHSIEGRQNRSLATPLKGHKPSGSQLSWSRSISA
jgi:hypothetical protein